MLRTLTLSVVLAALASPLSAQPSSPATGPGSDPRVGLRAGVFDAEEAVWNLRKVSATPPPDAFVGETNSDLAFRGDYAVQGNYHGFVIWDLSDPSTPEAVAEVVCPGSQGDVSVVGDLLFVSNEGFEGRLDCGTEGVEEAVSAERFRGLRIWDLSDIRAPEPVAAVQTCRGSHTHSVVADPSDPGAVYVYVSGTAPVRPAEELAGCAATGLDEDPESSLFRIEVVRVPLDAPERAAVVATPRPVAGLAPPPTHGLPEADLASARESGQYVGRWNGQAFVLHPNYAGRLLRQLVEERGGTGEPTAADSAALHERLPAILAADERERLGPMAGGVPNHCHDVTLFADVGLAGGACQGYGILLDISDPASPRRLVAVADSNFSYWHSATFSNDGSKVLFVDEWGGGYQPKCRATDPREWGANAIYSVEERADGPALVFESYFKAPPPQGATQNCTAHNGSVVPIPGRDVMVQAWFQGGISVFDWTDPSAPVEIAYFDRGPLYAERLQLGGSWSAYWYDGLIVSSEIARGLDVFELVPSEHLTQNEIDAAQTVQVGDLNVQGQGRDTWPPSFALARAYTDQLERAGVDVAGIREDLAGAEARPPAERSRALVALAEKAEALDGAAARTAALGNTLRMLGR